MCEWVTQLSGRSCCCVCGGSVVQSNFTGSVALDCITILPMDTSMVSLAWYSEIIPLMSMAYFWYRQPATSSCLCASVCDQPVIIKHMSSLFCSNRNSHRCLHASPGAEVCVVVCRVQDWMLQPWE